MPDREKVIKGLEKLRNTFRDFREWYEEQIVTDALDLLKEQQNQIWELQDQVEYLTDKQDGR